MGPQQSVALLAATTDRWGKPRALIPQGVGALELRGQYELAGQATGNDEFVGQYMPRGQARGGCMSPKQNKPPGQRVHCALVALRDDPAGQTDLASAKRGALKSISANQQVGKGLTLVGIKCWPRAGTWGASADASSATYNGSTCVGSESPSSRIMRRNKYARPMAVAEKTPGSHAASSKVE
jgi:hypothetical protein